MTKVKWVKDRALSATEPAALQAWLAAGRRLVVLDFERDLVGLVER